MRPDYGRSGLGFRLLAEAFDEGIGIHALSERD